MPRRVEAKNGGRSSQGKEEEYWNILKMVLYGTWCSVVFFNQLHLPGLCWLQCRVTRSRSVSCI